MKKTLTIIAAIGCVLIPALCLSQSPVTLEVQVMGAEGKALQHAYVKITSKDFKKEVIRQDGQFKVHLPDTGVYELWAGGVHHKSIFFPLLIERGEPVNIKIQLATASYQENIDSVSIAGDFNHFSTQNGTLKMTRLENGKFRATVPVEADTLAYQLIGVQYAGHPIEGTHAHRYSYQISKPETTAGSTKFISVIKTREKITKITFDPDQLPDSGILPTIQFNDADSRMAKIANAASDANNRNDLVYHAFIDHARSGAYADERQYDKSKDEIEYTKLIGEENDPLVKQYLLLKYFSFLANEASAEKAQLFLQELPPHSKIWELEPDAYAFNWISKALNYSKETDEYVHRLINSQNKPSLISSFLYLGLERSFLTGNHPMVGLYYSRLMKEFPGSWYAANAIKKYDPANKFFEGKPVPFFKINSLRDDMSYTPENMKGKVYLMDFWATWCAPCIEELPALHQIYEIFKDKGFTILSISADDQIEKINTFRKRKWEMPWLHAMLTNGLKDPLAVDFEVTDIPRAVLVDERGIILANRADIAKEGLKEILKRHFSDKK
ncbi:MAG: thioredoxin-like domain-containing protein [Cyclobacteriaceae bacterium]